jgi:UDP-GlcNAc:undecaprenyl-phosphate GlcNAc-1-phosphate transferase
VALAAPTALLVIPAFDTAVAILRRKLTGRSLYTTDRGHLHHCLLRRGWTTQGVLLVIGALCLVTVAGVLLSLALKNEMVALLSAVVVVAILVVTRLFGHGELSLLGQRCQFLAASFLGRADAESGRESAVRLQGSLEWQQLMRAILKFRGPLNLKTVRLDVNAPALHEGYHARWDRPDEETEERALWRTEVPLTSQRRVIGRLEIEGYQDDEPVSQKMGRVSKLVQDFETTAALLTDGAWEAAFGETPADQTNGHAGPKAAHGPGVLTCRVDAASVTSPSSRTPA